VSAGCSDTSGDTNDASVDSSTDGRVTIGDAGAGDASVVGDAMFGDTAIRDGAVDDSVFRDATVGDARVGDDTVVDSPGGEVGTEDAARGDAALGDTTADTFSRDAVIDAPVLDASGGDAAFGDASRGDTSGGDAATGDAPIGDSATEDGGGGDSGTGDAANVDATLGDAPADTAGADGARSARASVSLHVQEYDPTDPQHGMDRCPPARHWVNVPYQRGRGPTTQYQHTSATDAPSRAVQGLDGDAVACTVRANGATFDAMLDASGYAVDSNQQTILPSIVHIRIPSIGNGDLSATGTITVQDHASLVTYTSDECVFSTQGGSLGVTAGRIWGSVHCENLMDPSSPGAACLLDTGFFLFEDCSR
jgi:hypothetical protein